MKPESCTRITIPSKVSMHNDSRVISKLKPKIRIIHIFAPTIIKTDAANFRELVQRLTGKPADKKGSAKSAVTTDIPYKCPEGDHYVQNKIIKLENGEIIKKESKHIYGSGSFNGFWNGLADIDGLIQDLGEFPLLNYL